VLKLELFQYAGTFKPRGALLNMLELDAEQLTAGVTAVSAGNHAIAVAFAARRLGTHAKVVMLASANPFRVAACRDYGAEVELAVDGATAFARALEIEASEGRAFIHPFEGYRTALGTATVGLELCRQAGDLDAVVVPIGGGGLAAGISSAVKAVDPDCRVFGVEPEGADSMRRSFLAGSPQTLDRVDTIADSLGAPHAAPISFALCQRHVDHLVTVGDDELVAMMRLMFEEMKLAVEPAGAAAMAALVGPLRDELAGRRVGVIVCGSNIDPVSFNSLIAA
jgi:threonine dehydratase